MLTYLARRILSLVPVILGITFLAFLLGSLAPGDPAIQLYIARTGEPPPNNAVIEEIREDLGLNDTLSVRYVRWLIALTQGDMGRSYRTGQPVRGRHTTMTYNALTFHCSGSI